jgi:acid phosphatase (class A)
VVVAFAPPAWLGLGSAACAQPAERPAPRLPGYLGAAGVPDHRAFLPPPPANDSALGVADLEVFRATRALEGSARWQLAASDAEAGGNKMLEHFGCSLGAKLTIAEAPALARVMARASADLGPMIGGSKEHYQRPRPFLAEEGPVCVPYSAPLANSGSYPSGHAASGWLHALLFAEVVPERTAPILARGRAYGESRVVCGVHYWSDVEAGRVVATALVAALHGNAEFVADVVAARSEVAALRAQPDAPDMPSCANEAGALKTVW